MLKFSVAGALCALVVVGSAVAATAGGSSTTFVELPPFAEPWVTVAAPAPAVRQPVAALTVPGQCAGHVVVIDAGTFPDCDVVPPQRLDVRIPVDGGDGSIAAAELDCDNSGGDDLVGDTRDGFLTCEGVDY